MKSIVLKLSGKAISSSSAPIDNEMLEHVTDNIINLCKLNIKVFLVVGAGNIWRGGRGNDKCFGRVDSDTLGMLATTVNCTAIHFACKEKNISSCLMSNLAQASFITQYSPQVAKEKSKSHDVIIVSGGIGRPFFSTDTCAALCASEMESSMIMKASNVNGFYDKDPLKHSDAKLIKNISFEEATKKASVLFDETALLICMRNNISIKIFDIREKNCLIKAFNDNDFGSCIKN